MGGKVNAVLSAIENLLPIIGVQGYVSLFNATDDTFPGAVFAASACIAFLLLILVIYVHFSLRGQKISEVTKEGSGRLDTDDMAAKQSMEDDSKMSEIKT